MASYSTMTTEDKAAMVSRAYAEYQLMSPEQKKLWLEKVTSLSNDSARTTFRDERIAVIALINP